MRYFFLLFLILIFFSCEKESEQEIRYEVDCSGTCEVEYATSGGLPQTETVSDSWSESWDGLAGQQYYLSVTLTSAEGNFIAKVIIDGEIYEESFSSITGENRTLSGKIP